jgi:triacylglycerol lipase
MTRAPIVLVPGAILPWRWLGLDYFHGLVELCRRHGYRAGVARLRTWGRAEDRGEQLASEVERLFPGERVHLFGHSKGALDARYMIARLGMVSRVLSLTSIGAPHRGTPLGRIVSSSGRGAFRETMRELGDPEFEARWEELAPASPDVSYFSIVTKIRRPVVFSTFPLFMLTHHIIAKSHGDNDGFIPCSSAAWGRVLYEGIGDHLSQIAQPLGWTRGFPAREVYGRILESLDALGVTPALAELYGATSTRSR